VTPFISDPLRDASDVFAGFLYQIDLTIQRWVELKDDEILELERGEDLDVIQLNGEDVPETRTLEQIKRRSTTSISLKSADALTAVAHFCEHRKNNPSVRLRFRFLTTGTLAKEQAWKRPGTAISTWQAIQRENLIDEDQMDALVGIREFLSTCNAPSGINSDVWSLVEELSKEENSSALLEVIQSFEWGPGSADYPEVEAGIKDALLRTGLAKTEAFAESLFQRLFLFVFKRLSQPGIKQLTSSEIREQLRLPDLNDRDQAFLAFIRDLREVSRRVDQLEKHASRTDQILAAIQNQTSKLAEQVTLSASRSLPKASIDRPALVAPVLPRAAIVAIVGKHLADATWISVTGEPGAGKTHLCLLATETTSADTIWINLRGYSPEIACEVIDQVIERVSDFPFYFILGRWYQEATSRVGANKIFVLDDLPRVAPGGDLSRRLDALAAAARVNGQKVLSTSYYALPRHLVETHAVAEIASPRFSSSEISELLQVAGAPSGFPGDKIADFLHTLTGGLPVLVVAAARLLTNRQWKVDNSTLESFFGGQFAIGAKTDARAMIESTIPNDRARELLYRLTCVVGPISKTQIDQISKIPEKIHLAGDKLNQLLGLWVQPYADETFLLSPLVEPTLSGRLDSNTKRGVHAILAIHLTKRKPTTVLDVITCIHHFQVAELPDQAAMVLTKTLLAVTHMDREVPNESLLLTVWAMGRLPSDLDINIQLFLRALQVELADKQGADFGDLLADLDKLTQKAQSMSNAHFGLLAAGGSITIRFAKKHPAIANRYLLVMLRSAPHALLPDGTQAEQHYPTSLESLLWVTANSAATDEDVLSWIMTLRGLKRDHITALAASDFAADSSTVLCDQVWLREFRKQESQQEWPSRDALVQKIEEVALEKGLHLLYAAATHTRLTILGESQGHLDAAIAMAEERLPQMATDAERFLILETIGRQLSYVHRDEEALIWMNQAIQLNIGEFGIFRRNVLITAAEVVARTGHPESAPAYTSRAVEVARASILEPVRLAEALGEHSLALWNAGRAEESFAAWEEGVEKLLDARDQKPPWTQTFLLFLQAAGFFSGMSLWGKITEPTFAIPKPGHFLEFYNMPVEKYQRIQDGLLLLRTAMFADGVLNTAASAKWANRAFEEAQTQPGSELLNSFAWLPIPHLLETAAYDQAIKLAYALTKRKIPNDASLKVFEFGEDIRKRTDEFFTEPRIFDRTLMFSLVPIAFRLATLRIDRDITADLDVVTSTLEQLSPEPDSPWKQAAQFLRSAFSTKKTWMQWHDEIAPLYASKQVALGVLASFASVLDSPVLQSLVSQIGLARNLEQVFRISPSIRAKFVAPFFTRYWEKAVQSSPEQFRTSAAYTQRAYSEAASVPPLTRVKKLLATMVFCTNLNLSDMAEDLRAWLADQAS
jgi:hypothetical protein